MEGEIKDKIFIDGAKSYGKGLIKIDEMLNEKLFEEKRYMLGTMLSEVKRNRRRRVIGFLNISIYRKSKVNEDAKALFCKDNGKQKNYL